MGYCCNSVISNINSTWIFCSLIIYKCGVDYIQCVKVTDCTAVANNISVVNEFWIFHVSLFAYFENSQLTSVVSKYCIFNNCISSSGSSVNNCIISYNVVFKYCVVDTDVLRSRTVDYGCTIVTCNYTVVHGQFTVVFNETTGTRIVCNVYIIQYQFISKAVNSLTIIVHCTGKSQII